MARLRPISVPIKRRWREFRIQYLPLIAFAASVMAAIALWGEFALPRQVESTDENSTSLQPSLDTAQGALTTIARISGQGSITNASSGYSD